MIKNEDSFSIVMTATVKPTSNDNLVIQSAKDRELQYIKAVELTRLALPSAKIVMIENSGYSQFNIERECLNNDVRFICFPQNALEEELVRSRGKGAGELIMLKKLSEESSFRVVNRFLKVTGRYYINNVRRFYNFTSVREGSVCANLYNNKKFADSRVFSYDRIFLDVLFSYLDRINDREGVFFEHILAQAIGEAKSRGMTWRYLPDYPSINGFSGSTGEKYNSDQLNLAIQRTKLFFYRRIFK